MNWEGFSFFVYVGTLNTAGEDGDDKVENPTTAN